MAPRRPQLSKSRVLSAWQCPKKLYLEKHRAELAKVSTLTQAMFAAGHRVGEVARKIYGTSEAVEIPFNRRTGLMLQETKALVESDGDFPIFEATFQYEGVLVRVDVLLPDDGEWRVVEVKASTSVKDYHILDCAIQDWVLRQCGLPVKSIALAHIDNQFVYAGNSDYEGILAEVDLTEEVRTVEPTVETLVARAREAISGGMPKVRVGAHCGKPFDCPFAGSCWPTDAKYPITGLGGSKAKLGDYVSLGYTDVRDVGAASIAAETQLRIHRITCGGQAEVLKEGGRILAALPYPRYYLDFETIAPAVPFWPGTRPYAAVPVQWSCHIDDGQADGSHERMRHEEFLDLSGEAPMRSLAEALVCHLGDTGPVIMYTNYEERVINGLIELFPDLSEALQNIVHRLFDLHPVVKANYYHPRMLGSWSIKSVVPTLAPNMDYEMLEGVKEGAGASEGFIEAINRDTTRERKAQLEEQLLRYCKFDTQAMAEIVRFLQRSAS